jgi:hypothetical protein
MHDEMVFIRGQHDPICSLSHWVRRWLAHFLVVLIILINSL